MLDAQLKRGLLDICVLRCIADGDSYGYQIIRQLEDCIAISESTLYPILKRLESSNALETYLVEHNSRLRRFYRITETGKERISEFLDAWPEVMRIYQFIDREVPNHDKT